MRADHYQTRLVLAPPPQGLVVLGLAVSSWALVALAAVMLMRLIG
jgi:hypothetical protein